MVKPPLRTKSIGFKVSEEEYAFLEYGGSSDYLHKDWLGNARIASLIAGQTIGADLAYAPYGEVYNFIAGASGDWMFTGDVTQLDSEYLFDTPNREFAAKNQGRWLSPDPAGTGWNQYAYATNPLISVDPSGLACYPLEKQVFGTCAGFGLLGDDNGGYTLDGVDAPVWLVMSLLNGGTAIQCPNNNCSFVRTGPNGQFQQYVPYPTTQSGLTIYTGNGSWISVSQGSVFQTSGAANNFPNVTAGPAQPPPLKPRCTGPALWAGLKAAGQAFIPVPPLNNLGDPVGAMADFANDGATKAATAGVLYELATGARVLAPALDLAVDAIPVVGWAIVGAQTVNALWQGGVAYKQSIDQCYGGG
jgi:RHS repeat-associated protein